MGPPTRNGPGGGPGPRQVLEQNLDASKDTPGGLTRQHSGPDVASRVDRYRPLFAQFASATVAIGDQLLQDKEQLAHGQFGILLDELEMLPRTAQKLMAIARNQVIRDANHGSHLPASMTALYELSRLPEDDLIAAIEDRRANTKTTRAEAAALRAGTPDEQQEESPVDLRKSPEDYLPDPDELAAAFAYGGATDEQFEAALTAASAEGNLSQGNVLRQVAIQRMSALEDSIDAGVARARSGLESLNGIGRLRILDSLLRGVGEPDHEIGITLLSMAIEILDGMPPAPGPSAPVGALSTAISAALPTLWQGDGEAIVRELAALTVTAGAVPREVRADVLLQVLDGRTVEELHPTTRLVVDAILAGFALEQAPA